ncbi:polymeric immunoglobulin receptor-like [Dromaius novaehollandiae]|uniref:polymeric immunoglobulin receptor-like n=1 Tax=Dromaius novaehollandiae TaxID=8790 RepID=UPI00311EF125
MAMELRVLLLLPLCCPGLRAQTPGAEESRREGSTLSVQCLYTPQAPFPSQKAWCRVNNGICEALVGTTYSTLNTYINEATQGTVTIEDDVKRGAISITMKNLQVQDSGTYSCASQRNTNTLWLLKTISLNVFKELHRWELDSLSVQCPYNAQTPSTTPKAWCRRQGPTSCNTVVSTNYPSTRQYTQQSRTSIRDNTQGKTVTITMQKLQQQDSGVYWCVLYTQTHRTRIMEVRLTVSKRTQQYTARESDTLSILCPYSPRDYGAVTKAWCKVGAGEECAVLARTDRQPSGHRRTAQPGTTTIQDDSHRGIVTVTMEKLRAEDSGVYWCALYEHPHLFRIVEVTLNISNASTETTLSVTATTSQTTPSANDASFTTTAPSKSSSVNIFILLSVVLGILLILALISMITLYIKKCRRGNRQAEDIYEKPEDTAQFQSTERMGSPRNDSNDLKYVTLHFTTPLSPEEPLYANVGPSQAPRKPKAETVEYADIALKELPTNDKG